MLQNSVYDLFFLAFLLLFGYRFIGKFITYKKETKLGKVVNIVNDKPNIALAGVAQWIECRLQTKGSPVQFPVRAHAWVAGRVPNKGHMRGNCTLMFLFLSFSLSSPLSKNK